MSSKRLAWVGMAMVAASGQQVGQQVGLHVGLAMGQQAGQPVVKQQKTQGAQPEAKPLSALDISALRETALNKIEELAKSPDAQVRANAVEAAGQSPKRLAAIIEAGLSDSNAGVRTVACVVVGKQKLTNLSERTAALLTDNSEYVRAGALFAQKKCGQAVDISPLSGFLLDSTSTKIRSHAAYLLGELGDKSAVPMLRQAATAHISRAGEIEIRLLQLQAGEAMAKLGEDSALESIRAALYAAHPEELEASVLAAQILGNLKDRSSMNMLGSTVDVDPKNPRSQQPAELRLAATAALAQLGNRTMAFVAEQYLSDPSPAIRAQVAFVLGEIGGSNSLRQLDALMSDPSPGVQISAAYAVLKAAGR